MDVNPIIMIPSRLASLRLPNKPLLDIAGKPMIQRVWELARSTGKRTVVACGDKDIFDLIISLGGEAVMTHPETPTGTDRIWEALQICDPEEAHKTVINFQGDIVEFDIENLKDWHYSNTFEVGVLGFPSLTEEEKKNPSVVKVYYKEDGTVRHFDRKYLGDEFSKVAKHVGIYKYTRDSLKEFVRLKPSYIEEMHSLEQLRGMGAGMFYHMTEATGKFLEVNTKEDLEAANEYFKQR